MSKFIQILSRTDRQHMMALDSDGQVWVCIIDDPDGSPSRWEKHSVENPTIEPTPTE